MPAIEFESCAAAGPARSGVSKASRIPTAAARSGFARKAGGWNQEGMEEK